MPQDDLKPYNRRPGEANTKAEQPIKSEERYPTHHSRLDEQGKVPASNSLKHDLDSQSDVRKSSSAREYRIW